MKSTSKKNTAQLNNDLSSEEIIEIGRKAYEAATAVTWKQAEVGRRLTQNDKIALVDDRTLVVGADIGSDKHDIRAFDNRGREISKKAFEFPNNEAGFGQAKAWMSMLRDECHLEKVMVGMEPTGHYWFNLASWLMNEGAGRQPEPQDGQEGSKGDCRACNRRTLFNALPSGRDLCRTSQHQ